MTYPIGTLLADGGRHFLVDEIGKCVEVHGPFVGRRGFIEPWMTPVPCPPNVTESPTVPDWASSVPLGGMVLK